MSVDFLDLEALGLAVVAFQTAALVAWAVAEAVRGLRTRSSAMVGLQLRRPSLVSSGPDIDRLPTDEDHIHAS